jgi:hypothetical protein
VKPLKTPYPYSSHGFLPDHHGAHPRDSSKEQYLDNKIVMKATKKIRFCIHPASAPLQDVDRRLASAADFERNGFKDVNSVSCEKEEVMNRKSQWSYQYPFCQFF